MCIMADASRLAIKDDQIRPSLADDSKPTDPLHVHGRELRSRDITADFTQAASGAYEQPPMFWGQQDY